MCVKRCILLVKAEAQKPPKSPSVRGWWTHYNVSAQNTVPPLKKLEYAHIHTELLDMTLDFMLYWKHWVHLGRRTGVGEGFSLYFLSYIFNSDLWRNITYLRNNFLVIFLNY